MTYGVMPENPERDGFYWLQRNYDGKFFPFEWGSDAERWDVGSDVDGYPEDMANSGFTYHGPCTFPVEVKNLRDQIAELRARLETVERETREACAKVCDGQKLIEISMPADWHNDACKMCAAAIRRAGEKA